MKTKSYLAIVQHAKNVIAKLPDRESLNPQAVADSVIASCGGDLSKAEAAFKSHVEQTASNAEPSIVQRVLSRRRFRA